MRNQIWHVKNWINLIFWNLHWFLHKIETHRGEWGREEKKRLITCIVLNWKNAMISTSITVILTEVNKLFVQSNKVWLLFLHCHRQKKNKHSLYKKNASQTEKTTTTQTVARCSSNLFDAVFNAANVIVLTTESGRKREMVNCTLIARSGAHTSANNLFDV